LLIVIINSYRVLDIPESGFLLIIKSFSSLKFQKVSHFRLPPPGGHKVQGAMAIVGVFRALAGVHTALQEL
jgi:hypothetical protein